jgi:hypothetical protein
MLCALIGLLLLLPTSFGGITIRCNDDEQQDVGDAFDNLVDAIEDAF